MLQNKFKMLLTVAVVSSFMLGSVNSFAGSNSSKKQATISGKLAYINSISKEQQEIDKAKRSQEGNFNFYVFLAQYGVNNFRKALANANPSAAEKIHNSKGVMTASLDIPSDPNSNNKHVLFLGFSTNQVVKVTFDTTDFNEIGSVELLQSDTNREGWFGGIQSMTYDLQTAQLFVGLGNKIVTQTTDESDYLASLFFLQSINVSTKIQTDGEGAAMYVYNFNKKNWQIVRHPSKDKGSVRVMRAFKYNHHDYLFSFSTSQQPLQTIHTGFTIGMSTNPGAPIPTIYGMPTGSGGDVENLIAPTNGLQLSTKQGKQWYSRSISQNWSTMPTHYAMGNHPSSILFASFKDKSIKAFNVIDDKQEWNDLIHVSNWSPISSLLYSSYDGKGGYVFAGLQDGTIQMLDLGNWKPGQKAPLYLINKGRNWNSNIMFLKKSPPRTTSNIANTSGRYIIAVLENSAIEYYDLKTKQWTEIHSPGNYKPTAVSNVLYDGHDYIFYVGYWNGQIDRYRFDPNLPTPSHDLKTIKTKAAPLIDDNDDSSLTVYGLNGTYAVNNKAVYPYPVKIEANEKFVIAYTGDISYQEDGPHGITNTVNAGMGINVHQIGIPNDWNQIAKDLSGEILMH